ncbi:unnamed protein product, partial [Vitis vinifera]|uniref:Uncharacterized protein n=1 Tax=Vitis vinifera TaxID=29760 RepID=D7UDL2_VITVI
MVLGFTILFVKRRPVPSLHARAAASVLESF